MHRTLGNIIADTLQLSLGYADRLLTGIPADQFARFATVGGPAVNSNHPAFVYGHLCLYAPKILGQLDLPAPTVPPAFEAVFSKDAQCLDDPQGTIYPGLEEVMQVFREGYRPVVEGLRGVPDAVLERPNPAQGRMAELFPTLGSVHTFYCGGHMMMHLGQLSAWRRMQGMAPA